MGRRLTTASNAARAFEDAKIWLLQPGAGRVGQTRWRALRNTGRILIQNPYLGPASLEVPGHRQIVVSGYRVIYRVDPDTGHGKTAGDIRIVAVFGPGQEARLP